MATDLHTFTIFGREAILLDGRVEVSATNNDEATKIIMKLSYSLMNNKIKSLRINLPNKIFFIKAVGSSHLHFRCDSIKENVN